jgi:hypothetical protein
MNTTITTTTPTSFHLSAKVAALQKRSSAESSGNSIDDNIRDDVSDMDRASFMEEAWKIVDHMKAIHAAYNRGNASDLLPFSDDDRINLHGLLDEVAKSIPPSIYTMHASSSIVFIILVVFGSVCLICIIISCTVCCVKCRHIRRLKYNRMRDEEQPPEPSIIKSGDIYL